MPVSDAAYGSWILGSMSSGVVAIDARHTVVMMNDGAQRILGCPAGDVSAAVGADCRELLASQPAVAELLIEALNARSPLSRAELVLEAIGERGESTIGFTLSPVRDDRSRVCGAAMIFRDLTPFERMDEQDRLRERLAALGQMAADMAHEIRNPLAGMKVVAGLLRRRLGDRPEEQALVDQITCELRSVADTVTASLEFVMPVALERRPLDPVALVEEAIAAARSRLQFAGAIDRDFGPDLPEIAADPEQIRSVVTNLIVNAFEAMGGAEAGSGARLGVSVKCLIVDRNLRSVRVNSDGRSATSHEISGRELVIGISDTGAGIPAELREKVFYPFFTTKQHGSGIGLAAAQKIVASHGGRIEVGGEVGEGASFRVRIPFAGSEHEPRMHGSVSRRSEQAGAGGDA
jgi:nitrogen-specific signal transduction histidine kinase